MANIARRLAQAMVAVTALAGGAAQATLNISSITVGNAGNAADTTGRGSVSYLYSIATTEVTNAQYSAFLNAVAASDPYELYNTNMGSNAHGGIVRSGAPGSYTYAVKSPAQSGTYNYNNKPVVYVSWYDSVRFTNWLHNGQGSGSTETGSYTLLGGTPTPSNGATVTRNANATWVIPTENEWYKAAYHKNDGVTGNYWDYPTGSDSPPNNLMPSLDTGNSANFVVSPNMWTLGPDFSLTDVGAYTLSDSPYGTFDQAGNAYEWTEVLSSVSRIARGGSWNHFVNDTRSNSFQLFNPTVESNTVGFRVAAIPEPSPALFGLLITLALLWWKTTAHVKLSRLSDDFQC